MSDIQSGSDDGQELDNVGTAGQFTAVLLFGLYQNYQIYLIFLDRLVNGVINLLLIFRVYLLTYLYINSSDLYNNIFNT